MSPYYFIDHDEKQFHSGHVILKALEPIDTEGMTEADHVGLMERTREVMVKEYEKLALEVGEMGKVGERKTN